MTTDIATDRDVVLKADDLRTYFQTRWGTVKAVDGISFVLRGGETLGIVGESGSGKSVTMLSLMRLIPIPPGRIVSGSITLDGEDLLQYSESEMNKVRGSKIALIIQDPMTSLNPVFTIGSQVSEAIKIHQDIPKRSVMEQALSVLRKVNISAAKTRIRDYPHQISGGMRQRVVGAIGISCQPQVLIADEPTTSLDVAIQAQYLALLKELQRDSNVGMVFITHDFGIVAKMCDRVAVMYAGRIVEQGSVRDTFNNPSHPWNRGTACLCSKEGRGCRQAVFNRRPASDAARPASRVSFRAPRPVCDGPLSRGVSRTSHGGRGSLRLLLAIELI